MINSLDMLKSKRAFEINGALNNASTEDAAKLLVDKLINTFGCKVTSKSFERKALKVAKDKIKRTNAICDLENLDLDCDLSINYNDIVVKIGYSEVLKIDFSTKYVTLSKKDREKIRNECRDILRNVLTNMGFLLEKYARYDTEAFGDLHVHFIITF